MMVGYYNFPLLTMLIIKFREKLKIYKKEQQKNKDVQSNLTSCINI